jgi:alpha-L-fucosidase
MKKLAMLFLYTLLVSTTLVAQNSKQLFPDMPAMCSYTYRNSFTKDVAKTLDTLKDLGFKDMEFSNLFGKKATELRAMLDERGMYCSSFGVSYGDALNKTKEVGEKAKTLGAKFVRVAWIMDKAPFTLKDAQQAVENFNKIGKQLEEEFGIRFCYHNHGYEFEKHGEGTLMDYIIQNTNPNYVSFEIDILWVAHPGHDPAALIEKYGNRFKLMHLKDLKRGVIGDLSGKTSTENDVALGTGQINIPAVLRAAKKAGIGHYYIEDESSAYYKQVPQSLAYLKNLPLVFTVPKYLKGFEGKYNQNPREANGQWFKDAQFGLFIHYGLYSQLGKGEWVQFTDTIPVNEYAKLKSTFTAKGFDAQKIVQLAKKAGMKYITITSKHHDGFCLFKTKETDFNSVNSPAKRDLIGEMVKACEKEGLGLFIYYSYAADWHHPYFYPAESSSDLSRPFYKTKPAEYKYEKPQDFKIYLDYVHAQLRELLTQYPTIAGIWFDPIRGVYNRPEMFPIDETYALIRQLSPHALISFKQGANGDEDFMAPERGGNTKVAEGNALAQKVYVLNQNKPKEVCNTMQPYTPALKKGTWGYHKLADGLHLKVPDVQKLLQDAKANQYNLLLNVGPLPDGSIHKEDVETLSKLK